MTESDFQPLIAWLELKPSWVFIAVLLISFIESLALAGVVVPGVLLLFLVSALAGHINLPIEWLLLSGFLGAILGDGLSFFLGHYFRDSLRAIWPFSRYPKTLKMGEDFFHKHGGKSVMLGRFIGPVRPVIPIVAGMLGMSQTRFSIFNAASAVIWAPFYILPGYLTGSAVHLVLPSNFYPALFSLVLALLVIALSFRYASLNLQDGSRIYNTLLNNSNPKTSSLQNKHEFPLASLTLFIASTLFFIVWSFLLLRTSILSQVDSSVLQLGANLREMNPLVSDIASRAFIHLTLLGDEKFLYASFILLISLLLYLRQYRASSLLVISGLSTAAITHLLKAIFSIARPELVLSPPLSFAYPSGHSSGSTVFYGLIAAFIAQNMPSRQRWKYYLLFFVPMFLIAFSRVMLSVHWLSDIIGGIALGLAICGISRVIYSPHQYHDSVKRRASSSEKRAIIVALSLWGITMLAYQAHFFPTALQAYELKP